MDKIKIGDSSPSVTAGSRADEYWMDKGMEDYYKRIRPRLKLPASLKTNDPDAIVKKFQLAGIGFGNWVTVEDRMNYLNALTLSLYDLNKVLQFGYNIGFGLLSITFGARGMGSALAHYEPHTDFINITRYRDRLSFWTKGEKEVRFFGTGGLGSLAHEYGHFLDYFAGSRLAHGKEYSLTGGRSVNRSRINEGSKQELRQAMDDVLEALYWKVPDKTPSRFFERLKKQVDDGPQGRYWIQRNEVWARTFEVYVKAKLKKAGITNHLLVDKKYNDNLYPSASEVEKLTGKIDRVIKLIRAGVK